MAASSVGTLLRGSMPAVIQLPCLRKSCLPSSRVLQGLQTQPSTARARGSRTPAPRAARSSQGPRQPCPDPFTAPGCQGCPPLCQGRRGRAPHLEHPAVHIACPRLALELAPGLAAFPTHQHSKLKLNRIGFPAETTPQPQPAHLFRDEESNKVMEVTSGWAPLFCPNLSCQPLVKHDIWP